MKFYICEQCGLDHPCVSIEISGLIPCVCQYSIEKKANWDCVFEWPIVGKPIDSSPEKFIPRTNEVFSNNNH